MVRLLQRVAKGQRWEEIHHLTKTKIATLHMPCLIYVSRFSRLQKVPDNWQSAHTHLQLSAELLSQTVFFKSELPDHIFAWKTTQNIDPFTFLFRLWYFWNGTNFLLKLLLSVFNLFYTEPIDRFQVKMYPVHYQAKVLISCLRVKGFATASVNLSPTAVVDLLYKPGIFQEDFVHPRWITVLDTMPSKNDMLLK